MNRRKFLKVFGVGAGVLMAPTIILKGKASPIDFPKPNNMAPLIMGRIRRCYPSTIASELVGVHPMKRTSSAELRIVYSSFETNEPTT
ncbi:MAG: hypothetical protein QM489_00520 [Candidatus Izemoplasma sp.]